MAKGKDGSLDKLTSSEFLLLVKSVNRYTYQLELLIAPPSGQMSEAEQGTTRSR